MDNISIWTILIPALSLIAIMAGGHWLHKRATRNVEAYKQQVGQNVLAMSRILLSTLAAQVAVTHKELRFLRDDRFSFGHDRGAAVATVNIFTNYYNLAVAPAIALSPAFEDIMVTKVDSQDTADGIWLQIHLGQGNDVVKHFLPDHGLQSFITGIRAISSYMQIGVDAGKQ